MAHDKVYAICENMCLEETYTKNKIDNELANKANSNHTHSWDNITGKPSTFPPSSHNHDDRYYTETEVNNLLNGKQKTISYGTSEPSGGNDGDIYLKYS